MLILIWFCYFVLPLWNFGNNLKIACCFLSACPDNEIQRRKIWKVMSKKKWDTISQKRFKICLWRWCDPKLIFALVTYISLSLRHWNTGLVSSRVSLVSWGVGHRSGDGIMIKMPYGVDVLLHSPASHPIFSYSVG